MSIQNRLGVVYAVRAFDNECANAERAHDEFFRCGPSSRICPQLPSRPFIPPMSPPLLLSLVVAPFRPPFLLEYSPISLSPSSFARPDSCQEVNVNGAAFKNRHAHLLPGLLT